MEILFLVAALGFFALGTLTGATWVEQVRDARSRRQAARQRELNDQARSLREQWELLRQYQESSDEEMRWEAKRQAGLVVLDYADVSHQNST